jgi:hypothetical protein
MRARSFVVVVMLGLAAALGGCARGEDAMDSVQEGLHKFNPFGTAKKPLPGQRKAMFPEGVPGVQQGVPPDLMKGAPREPEPVVAAPAPAPEPRARARRVRTTAAPPAERPQRPARQPRRSAPPSGGPPDPDAVWPPPPQASSRPAAAPRAAPASRAAPPVAVQPAGQGGWQPPASQPVPTQWPDPPKTQ